MTDLPPEPPPMPVVISEPEQPPGPVDVGENPANDYTGDPHADEEPVVIPQDTDIPGVSPMLPPSVRSMRNAGRRVIE